MPKLHGLLAGGCYGLLIAVIIDSSAFIVAGQEWPSDICFASLEESTDADSSDIVPNTSKCWEDAEVTAPPPMPNYGGCCWCRSDLAGDWGGCRTCQAEQGIVYDFDVTNFYFGNTSGGLRRRFAYGGHGDYVINMDGGKLGIRDGLFIKLRAEHRFGDDINGDTGAFLPATLLTELPVSNSEELYLTDVLFTQMLSDNFAVFAGKIETLDGDANAFAHGRGKTQFSNTAFCFNPLLARTIPYSTLATGFSILQEGESLFTFTVLNATDTTRTSGFDELFAEGVAMSAQLRLPTQFFGRPGHQLVGGAWNSREFVSLGQDPRADYPDLAIEKTSGTWGLFWNFDQYVYVDPHNPAAGWGVFGRAAIGDDEANPIEYFLSGGIGGSGMLAGREADTFGVGYYIAGTSSEIGPIIETVFGPIGNGQGLEMFYNVALTPWLHVTPDMQVIIPARDEVDTAIVVGVRANLAF